jgi:hypothetical protein
MAAYRVGKLQAGPGATTRLRHKARSGTVGTGFPSGQTQGVCPGIMLKQRDEIMIRFNLIGS